MHSFIETRDLAVGYDGHVLIRDISFSLDRGEILTLIGPNGAGKSTILKSITRQLKPLSGQVLLDGCAMEQIPARLLSRRVAVVLTEPVRPELMRCYDVVAAGRYPYTGRLGLLSDDDRRIVDAAMERFSIVELRDRDFTAISDGQRQRVLLARAFAQEPELIVLDEPTSYLDIRYKLKLLSTLRELAREKGIAVILSLHEIDLAQKLSDRILCVQENAVECGTPESIFSDKAICALYNVEAGSYNTRFGSVELSAPTGAPRVFVIAGGGSGIPIFRRLQREDMPFATGILHENDIDCQLAQALACEVITEAPFCEISVEHLEQAQALMARCATVLMGDVPIGPGNARIQALIDAARARGVLRRIERA